MSCTLERDCSSLQFSEEREMASLEDSAGSLLDCDDSGTPLNGCRIWYEKVVFQ